MVDIIERYQFILVIFLLYLFQHVETESKLKHSKSLEKSDVTKDASHMYTSLKANHFLSYDKCIQRMKCPVSRKEECREECRAGNTEEEIEEHKELTQNERPHVLRQKPKAQFEIKQDF
ncbi:hypothetical protein I4U23_019393 [Adineta vaga]|nr:hypothetical protein I4U23_019393 [Adineta vaga]